MKTKEQILADSRFSGLTPFDHKVWLSSPTMHGEEMEYVRNAIETNWVSTVGENINELEKMVALYLGMSHAVALSCGTAALHMCTKLAAAKLYPGGKEGNFLFGHRVFCSDMTFDASVNPIVYEGGEPVFIGTEEDTWNMSPEALKKAFEFYPDVKLVILAHLYGVPAKMDEIVKICREHGALIIEDAAEAMGARYDGKMCGSFGDYVAISFNGNKIVTGSAGGAFVTNSQEDAEKVRKWSTQSREAAPWYQHEELGYNYRLSNVLSGIVCGQMLHINEHIEQKKRIYERYRDGMSDLPVVVNPFLPRSTPNYWLSCLLIKPEGMGQEVRGDREYLYRSEKGKSTPMEILDALSAFNAEGRPIWKPMHMQPLYRMNPFITVKGNSRGRTNAYIKGNSVDVGADIFNRGLCLPSDNKMKPKEQDIIIDIIHRCF